MSSDVVAGDLNDLRIAAKNLGKMAEVYTTMAFQVGVYQDAEPDLYGRPHEWWAYVELQLATAMRFTFDRLYDGQNALLAAIDAYAYVDGDNAGELTEIGKEYKEFIADPDNVAGDKFYEPNVLHTQVAEPDLDVKPEGWEENYDG